MTLKMKYVCGYIVIFSVTEVLHVCKYVYNALYLRMYITCYGFLCLKAGTLSQDESEGTSTQMMEVDSMSSQVSHLVKSLTSTSYCCTYLVCAKFWQGKLATNSIAKIIGFKGTTVLQIIVFKVSVVFFVTGARGT